MWVVLGCRAFGRRVCCFLVCRWLSILSSCVARVAVVMAVMVRSMSIMGLGVCRVG